MQYENQRTILPLSFPVQVAGIEMQAKVMEDLSDHSCYKYKVRFESDIEDIFTIIEGPETNVQAADANNQHYGDALRHDLYELSKVIPENFLSVLQVKLNDEQTNLWLVEEEPDPGEEKCVIVSYNSKNGFQMYSVDGKWNYRAYRPEPLTEEEKSIGRELIEVMQRMYDPATLANLLSSGD